jgi:exopolysaccharide biosynthesis WecB/TagA/CpsF family protein
MSEKRAYCFDAYDVDGLVRNLAHAPQDRFGYVVTPNVDHLVRLHENPELISLYRDASYVVLDSRFLAHVMRLLRGVRLPVCPGSDLTARLFEDVIRPEDGIVVIGGSQEQARRLGERYRLRNLVHHNPPMGFIKDPQAVEACLEFIETHSPFRYCILAVGSPQQERIAQMLRQRGKARGMALCIGASINFLTGVEKRAPSWMQRLGMEWAFRLLQDPRRLAHRYLVRGPRIFGVINEAQISLRKKAVLLFANDAAKQFAQSSQRSEEMEVVGYFEDRDLARVDGGISGLPYLGRSSEVANFVRQNAVDSVFIFLPIAGSHRAGPVLRSLGDSMTFVYHITGMTALEDLQASLLPVAGAQVRQPVEGNSQVWTLPARPRTGEAVSH